MKAAPVVKPAGPYAPHKSPRSLIRVRGAMGQRCASKDVQAGWLEPAVCEEIEGMLRRPERGFAAFKPHHPDHRRWRPGKTSIPANSCIGCKLRAASAPGLRSLPER